MTQEVRSYELGVMSRVAQTRFLRLQPPHNSKLTTQNFAKDLHV
jgi:hypothetical protein